MVASSTYFYMEGFWGFLKQIDQLRPSQEAIDNPEIHQGIIATLGGGGVKRPRTGLAARQTDNLFPSALAIDSVGRNLYFVERNNIIWRMAAPSALSDVGELVVPSEDGAALFVFDDAGRHLRTENAATGETLMQFTYAEHYPPVTGGNGPSPAVQMLVEVEDAYGNVTSIERSADGTVLRIFGVRDELTTVQVNSDAYLETVTHAYDAQPAEVVQLNYDLQQTGLLTRLQDPRGGHYEFGYDGRGLLTTASDPADGGVRLDLFEDENGRSVLETTAQGRTTEYRAEVLETGQIIRSVIDSAGLEVQSHQEIDGAVTQTLPDGTEVTSTVTSDPRFAGTVQGSEHSTVTLPSGRSVSTLSERQVTGMSQLVPGYFESFTESSTVLGIGGDADRTWTSTYLRETRQLTSTSPSGRQSVQDFDTFGRPVSSQVPGIAQSLYFYDTLGRPSEVRQVDVEGSDVRSWTKLYDAQGFLAETRDPLGRSVLYDRDQAGRVVRQTLPDGRVVDFTHDVNGNVTSITPPSRPLHDIAYNGSIKWSRPRRPTSACLVRRSTPTTWIIRSPRPRGPTAKSWTTPTTRPDVLPR